MPKLVAWESTPEARPSVRVLLTTECLGLWYYCQEVWSYQDHLCSHFWFQDAKDVAGIMLINSEGIPIKTSLDSSVTAQASFSLPTFVPLPPRNLH